MLVIIARIINEKGEIEAVRVFDPETKEMRIVSVGRVKKAVLQGQIIKGFKRVKVSDYLNTTIRNHVIKEKCSNFNIDKVAGLNGKGELYSPQDEKILVYCGWKGFAEMKRHYLYNYNGEETVVDKEQLLSLIQQGVVNGATYQKDKKKLVIADDLNFEINPN